MQQRIRTIKSGTLFTGIEYSHRGRFQLLCLPRIQTNSGLLKLREEMKTQSCLNCNFTSVASL